jgi:uncharacterized membrane protein
LKLLGFGIVLGLVNILGAIVLLVGLLVSIPVTALAFFYVYRKLENGLTTPSPAPVSTIDAGLTA